MALYISGEIVLSREAYSKSSSASEGSSSGVRVLRRTGLGKGICSGMDDFDFVAAGVGTGEEDGEGDEGTIKDTLNKAIMAGIVLAGAVMADENCLLRVVGDSSILSVSPHRDRCGPGAAP